MFVGILQFELSVRGSTSLKDKRRVVKSIKDRLHREHQVSVAEVAAQDQQRLAVMALSLVGGSRARVADVLERVARKINSLPEAEVRHMHREILSESDCRSDVMEDGSPLWTEAERRDAPADTGGKRP